MIFMFSYRMCDEMTLILQHNGKFIQKCKWGIEYVGGEFCVWKEVETYLVSVWITHKLCKVCHNYVKFVSIYYLVLDTSLQRLENDRDVFVYV